MGMMATKYIRCQFTRSIRSRLASGSPIAHFYIRIFGLDKEQHNISARQFALVVSPSLFLEMV